MIADLYDRRRRALDALVSRLPDSTGRPADWTVALRRKAGEEPVIELRVAGRLSAHAALKCAVGRPDRFGVVAEGNRLTVPAERSGALLAALREAIG